MKTVERAPKDVSKHVKNVFTKQRLAMLEQAWSWEWSDEKASHYAGIDAKALELRLKTDSSLASRKNLLLNSALYIARKNVLEAMRSGDIKLSMWYLERRDKQFHPKKQLDMKVVQKLDESNLSSQLNKLLMRLSKEKEPNQLVNQSGKAIEMLPDSKEDVLDI